MLPSPKGPYEGHTPSVGQLAVSWAEGGPWSKSMLVDVKSEGYCVCFVG